MSKNSAPQTGEHGSVNTIGNVTGNSAQVFPIQGTNVNVNVPIGTTDTRGQGAEQTTNVQSVNSTPASTNEQQLPSGSQELSTSATPTLNRTPGDGHVQGSSDTAPQTGEHGSVNTIGNVTGNSAQVFPIQGTNVNVNVPIGTTDTRGQGAEQTTNVQSVNRKFAEIDFTKLHGRLLEISQDLFAKLTRLEVHALANELYAEHQILPKKRDEICSEGVMEWKAAQMLIQYMLEKNDKVIYMIFLEVLQDKLGRQELVDALLSE